MKDLYQKGIRVVADTDILLEKWIPQRIAKPFVPEKVGMSLRNAVAHLMPRKKPIIEALVPLFEKYIHLETAKFKLLNDEPLFEKSNSVPLLDDPALEPAIEQAVYGKKNPDQARMFLEKYAVIHRQNSKITVPDAIEEIRPEEHGINVSSRTIDTWTKDYKKALKRFHAVPK